MLPVLADLMQLWRNDPLRSFGSLLPFISFALILRVWRRERWTHQGTWWGLLPLALAVMLARTFGSVLVAYRFHGVEFSPVQPGLLCFAYGSGVVLLLGGTRLWRACLLPLCLLLCVNPVPHLFERLDYPLQTISANTARGFATLLGLKPSGEQLQMMFAPKFGMVIVPGCDGVHGSATMMYLALLIGYLRRMGARRTVALMIIGLLTGYLLNLTRLCTLVLYYWIGVHFPHLRGNGELIDYVIGGTLFLLVSFAAGFLLLRPIPEAQASPSPSSSATPSPSTLWQRVFVTPRWYITALLLISAALTSAPSAWALLFTPEDYIPPATATAALPDRIGPWQSAGHWEERYYGHTVWLWTRYHREDGANVDLAVWLSPKRHYAIQSRLMNGSKPLVGSSLEAQSADAMAVDLSTFTLQDDMLASSLPIPTFFAETVCLPSHCSVQESGFQQNGWIVAVNPMDLKMSRRLPLLFRVESTPGGQETPEVQTQARQQIAGFIHLMNLKTLTQSLGGR